MFEKDTIAAISTAVSESGIGVIRISGSDAFAIADRVCMIKTKGYHSLAEVPSHTIHYGFVKDPKMENSLIDEVLVLVFRSPRSYTTEDTVEISCHGGVYAMKKILDTVIAAGARPAEPGEFTRRAFLNGRIDLSQAEAVMDVIQAKNEYALRNSVSQVRGILGEKIDACRQEILYETAKIEAALDDPEHYTLDGYTDHLREKLADWKSRIEDLVRTASDGKLLQEGIQTAIVGKPNVGKSSLLNAMTGEDNAIVTDIAGTTRDVLSETVSFGDFSLNLMDTAGIRATDDKVETIGVERALKAAERADLVLWMIDSSGELDDDDRNIFREIRDKKLVILLNKTDLEPRTTADMLKEEFAVTDTPVINICAKTAEGMDALRETVRNLFYQGRLSFNDEVMITSARQKRLLEEALSCLDMVSSSLEDGMPEDFYFIDLQGACRALGAIIGKETGEDLINEIFDKFCMGK